MRVADAIGRTLGELGVSHVFGVVGSGNFHVTNALVGSGATFVAARHESAAVSMADAYARITRGIGVVTVHQGPGLTNAMTALTEAAKARTPLLVLAADTSAEAVRSNFRIGQGPMVAAVGAVAERVYTPDSAAHDLARAWHTATAQRRTVVLNLPLDVQAAVIDHFDLTLPESLAAPAPATAAIAAVADLIARSERPVIVGGRGAVLADARAPLEDLGDRIGALLATSANGHGLFAGSEWNVGISGGFATPIALKLLPQADLILGFGASLNMWTTRHGALVGANARIVQIDSDGDAIGAHRPVDVGVVADAAEAARAIAAELVQRSHGSLGFRDDPTRTAIGSGSWREETFDDASNGEFIDPRTASIALDELLPEQRTVALDSGHFMGWPPMYLRVPDPAGFVFAQAFQSIGLGLGSAIGAAVARPDRLTVACLGDGGALMAAGEFETAVRLGLEMLIVIYNDAAYGAEVHHFKGEPHDIVRFPDTDFAAFARGLGAQGATVRSTGDLKALEDWLGDPRGPFVADLKVVPTVVAEWLEEAFRSH
ncbi:MAG: thiamine pyrophosphate-binding protein [Actinomycetota bacterium]